MNPNELAFTDLLREDENGNRRPAGLTKRKWLIGMIASGIRTCGWNSADAIASEAVEIADEIIKQLNEESNEGEKK
jgi:hypothetical protein